MPNDTLDDNVEEARRKLQADLDAERARRQQSEQRERELETKLATATKTGRDNDIQIVQSGIDRLQTDRSVLLANYRAARESNDLEKETEIIGKLGENAAQKLTLEQGLEALKTTPAVEPPKPSQHGSTLDRLVAEMEKGGAYKSADWLRKHPEWGTVEKFPSVLAAHNLVIGHHKLPAESDEYYAKVEEILGMQKPAAKNDDDAVIDDPDKDVDKGKPNAALSTAAEGRRRSNGNGNGNADVPPAAAPAGGGGGGQRPGVVRLTPQQKEAAAISGLTEAQYAENLEKERQRGKGQVH